MRRAAVVAAAAAAGAAAGLALAGVTGSSHRAVTRVSVTKHGLLLPADTVAAFAGSSVVADNVAQSLHVAPAEVADRLRAHVVRRTALVELSYTDHSQSGAAQAVQEAASVLAALAPARFPGVSVSVVDPAHGGAVAPPFGRDAGLGALVGLILGGLATARRPRRRSAPRAIAADPPSEPAPQPEPEPEPEHVADVGERAPVPVPPPRVEPEPPRAPPEGPAWVAELRAALAAHGHEFDPDRVAEWEAYIDAFAAQAVGGELPSHLAGVYADVFEPLLERARA